VVEADFNEISPTFVEAPADQPIPDAQVKFKDAIECVLKPSHSKLETKDFSNGYNGAQTHLRTTGSTSN